jgi:hypothetical protein
LPEFEKPPSTADGALLLAFRAWGGSDFDRASARFSKAWRDRLRPAWASATKQKPDVAWAELRREHEGSSRADPSRVHPTWFIRALQSESPAIQRAIVANSPGRLGESLRRGLGLNPEDLATDRPADPEALGWALTLWTERLVGDVPDRDDDPPVVVAMTRLNPRELIRLVKVCGLVKHAFAIEGNGPTEFDEAIARFSALDRVRVGYFRRHIGVADPRLVPLARLDLRAIEGDRRQAHARVGLVTIGRLLESVEPHRARWALQHIPYPIARRMRPREATALSPKALQTWESWVMEAAWARLLAEGRLSGGREVSMGLAWGASS